MSRRRRWTLFSLAVLALGALVAFLSRDQSGDDQPGVAVGRGAADAPPGTLDADVLAGADARRDARTAAKATEPPSTRSADDTSRPARALVVAGRVVDEQHRPVARAAVAARVASAPEASGASDERGRFRLVVASPPTDFPFAAVRATQGDRAAAHSVVTDLRQEAAVDVGDLVLKRSSDLVVRVLDGSKPVAGARVWASTVGMDAHGHWFGPMHGTQWIGWSHDATTDDAGVARLLSVPDGEVRVLALADGPRRAEGQTTHPAGHVLDVVMGAARDVVVEVVEKAADGRATPLSGVRIGVETSSKAEYGQNGEDVFDDPVVPAPTDARGLTTLHSMPRGRPFALTVVGDGWIWPRWRDSVPLGLEDDRVRIEVPVAAESVRFASSFSDGATPEDRTVVRLEPDHDGHGWWSDAGLPVAQGRIEGGQFVIDGLRNAEISGIARLPDGRIARFSTYRVPKPESPRFHRPRTLSVVVREEDGRPASDVLACVRQESGHFLARGIPLDARGQCSIGDLPPKRLSVVLEANPDLVAPSFRHGAFEATLVRTVDLTETDGRAEFVVPPVVDAAILMTDAGRPTLPVGLVAKVRVHPAAVEFVDPLDAVWDPTAGEIRFRTRRPARGRELLTFALIPGRAARYVGFQWIEENARLECLVELGPTGIVVARVLLPDNRPQSWVVERRSTRDRWQPIRWVEHAFGDGEREFEVPVGRYRIRDVGTGALGEEREVLEGAKTPLVLDLSRMGWVEVQVEVPPGTNLENLVVRRSGDGIRFDESDRRSESRGTSTVRVSVPGDRPVRITASHPDLVSDREGEAVVTTPGDTVRLRLVPARK